MASKFFRQELPPEGGFGPIEWTRVPQKPYFKGWHLFLGWTIITTYGLYIGYFTRQQVRRWIVERNSGNMAIRALLKAEKDRAYLKALRRNRDIEEELMKNVPGWVVGTYFGDPIYHTRPVDEWHDVITHEYFAHARKWDVNYHNNFFKFN